MAKVTLTKLGLVKDTSIDSFEWNDQTIEVKQYLPIEDKLNLISTILNNSIDANGYYNSPRLYINLIIETIIAYTNITITDKQKADIFKLYDLFVSSGLSGEIIGNHMNPNEYAQIKTWTGELIHNIYEYRNSIYGVLDNVNTDYQDMDLDVNEIISQLSNDENLGMLKEVLTKLG